MFERDPRFIWKSFHWKSRRVTSTDLRFGWTKHFEYQKPDRKRVNPRCTREKISMRRGGAGETSGRGPARSHGGAESGGYGGWYTFCRKRGSLSFSNVSSPRVAKNIIKTYFQPALSLSWRKKPTPESQNTDRDAVGRNGRPRIGSPGRVEVALVNHGCCSCWPFPGLLSK